MEEKKLDEKDIETALDLNRCFSGKLVHWGTSGISTLVLPSFPRLVSGFPKS